MTSLQAMAMPPLGLLHSFSRRSLGRTPEPAMTMESAEQISEFDQASAGGLDLLYCLCAELIHAALPGAEHVHAADLACGPGRGTLRLAQSLGLRAMTGFDLSRGMLGAAQRNLARLGATSSIRFEPRDVLALNDVPDSSYGLTTCLLAAHQFPRPEQTADLLRTMDRITAPDGVAFLMDLTRPRSEALAGLYVRVFAAGPGETLRQDYLHSLRAAYTPAELAGLIPSEDAGPGPRWIHFTSPVLPLNQVVMRVPASRIPERRPLWDASPTTTTGTPLWRLLSAGMRRRLLRTLT